MVVKPEGLFFHLTVTRHRFKSPVRIIKPVSSCLIYATGRICYLVRAPIHQVTVWPLSDSNRKWPAECSLQAE